LLEKLQAVAQTRAGPKARSPPGMLSGFNTNIRYRDVLFHVQTEDSGRQNPHIITHLFHGGNILASEKSDYAEQLASDNLPAAVRALMEGQHKAMLKRLKRGDYDELLRQRLGAAFPGPCSDTASTDTEPAPAAAPAKAPPPARPVAAAPAPPRPASRAFGERVVSSKPLDEVVLDYLVENARKRKRPSK
jgi:hypothetical protein